MEETISKLNTLLASLQVQRANIQAAHWNLRGCYSFMTFHTYLGGLYEANSGHIDIIAEFIRIYKGSPLISLPAYSHHSIIEDAKVEATADIDKMLESNINENNKILTLVNELFTITDGQIDINDYMTTMVSDYGKRNWFFRSSLKKEAPKEEEKEEKEEVEEKKLPTLDEYQE